jgi:hypothetical protein
MALNWRPRLRRAHGGGKPKSLTQRQHHLLKRKVREQSDISLAELQSFLNEQESVSGHASTISRALACCWVCRSKKEHNGRRAQQPQAWLVLATTAPPLTTSGCASLTEAGVNLAMTRLRGRAPSGERVTERVEAPSYGLQTSLIVTLSLSGIEAVGDIRGRG